MASFRLRPRHLRLSSPHRGRFLRPAAAVGVLFIALPADQTVLQAQGSQGSAISAAQELSCLSEVQTERIRQFLQTAPPRDLAAEREALQDAASAAHCLRQVSFASRHDAIENHLGLLTQLLSLYADIPESSLKYEDRLCWAETALRLCFLPRSLPLEPPWNWEDLVDQALSNYHQVYRTARQILQRPDDYMTAAAAGKLGLDFRSPAPPVEFLEEFLNLGLHGVRKYPQKLAGRIGEVLGLVLCGAMELYPARSGAYAHAYYLLIDYDGGNLAGTAFLFEFTERLQEAFDLAPLEWARAGSPCGKPSENPEFPPFAYAKGRFSKLPSPLEGTLNSLDWLLRMGVENLEERSRSWSPWVRYSDFLYGLSRRLKIQSTRSSSLWQTRHLLVNTACDSLRKGMEYSSGHASEQELDAVRRQLVRQISEYAEELLRALRFRELIELVEAYLWQPQLFNEDQTTVLHTLLAKAYYFEGDVTSAALHAALAPITLDQLRTLDQELRSLGVGLHIRR